MSLRPKRKEILRKYVLMFMNGQIGPEAMKRHNSKERGIIHHYIHRGFSFEELGYMMSVLTNLGNEYTLEDDLRIVDLDGKSVFDEVRSKKYFTEFKKKVKELTES